MNHITNVKTIVTSSGQELPMRASALIPRLYRAKFGRDIMRDIARLKKSMDQAQSTEGAGLDVMDLTLFEDVAWIMAKHADPDVPSDPDAWLDTIDGALSIYEVLPQIMELWGMNTATTSVPKKK